MTRYCFFAYIHALFPIISINVVTMLTRISILPLDIIHSKELLYFVRSLDCYWYDYQLITLSCHVSFMMTFYRGLAHFEQEGQFYCYRSPWWLDKCSHYLFQLRLSLYHQCNYVCFCFCFISLWLGHSFSYNK